VAYLSALYLYSLLPKFLKEPFSLGFAPLTFPLAVGVTATQKYTVYLDLVESKWVGLVTQIFFIQLIIATLVIGYVVYKTLEMLIYSLGETNTEAF